MPRKATVSRKTKETNITLSLNLDGKGDYKVKTTIPFVDHMLSLMSKHGHLDLNVQAKGDIEVDYHHLIEDLGIVLGEAIKKALGEKLRIRRYGEAMTPMDDTLAQVVIDLSGRPYLVYKVKFPKGAILGAIVRGEEVIIPRGDSIVRPKDHLIILCLEKVVPKLEKLLTVKMEYF